MAITTFILTGTNAGAPLPWIEVTGVLVGTGSSGGAYCVPLRMTYPNTSFPYFPVTANGQAIVEPFNDHNAQLYGITGVVGGIAAQLIQPDFMTIPPIAGGTNPLPGYTYLQFECRKDIIDLQLMYGRKCLHGWEFEPALFPVVMPFSASWSIPTYADGYTVIADMSTFARNPVGYGTWPPIPPPSACPKTIGFGYSSSGHLMRGFAMEGLNSTLGVGFPAGKVFEGMMIGGCGGMIGKLEAATNLFGMPVGWQTYTGVTGAPPPGQGVVMVVNTETELTFMEASRARATPTYVSPNDDYKWYEIAGVPHASADWMAGLDNPISMRPVWRAMLNNMSQRLAGTALPPSVGIDGAAAVRSAAGSADGFAGSGLGPWTKAPSPAPLSYFPITFNWLEGAAAKTATLLPNGTVVGTGAANVASASLNTMTGVLSITFAATHTLAASPSAAYTVGGLGWPLQFAPTLHADGAPGVDCYHVWIGTPDPDDGNFGGGIRLPHLRTHLPSGLDVGAPVAVHRGLFDPFAEEADITLPTWPLTMANPKYGSMGSLSGAENALTFSGLMSPYETQVIASRYRTDGEYATLVAEAADYAVARRWILATERDSEYVTPAAALTLQQIIDKGARRRCPPASI